VAISEGKIGKNNLKRCSGRKEKLGTSRKERDLQMETAERCYRGKETKGHPANKNENQKFPLPNIGGSQQKGRASTALSKVGPHG